MFTTRGESPSFARVSRQVTNAWPRTLQPRESRSEPVPRLRHQELTNPGPSSLTHPICVLGLVGNGLYLHGCREAAAREGLRKGRRDAAEVTERKLADTANSQVSEFSHVRFEPLEAAIFETGRSLRGPRGRKKGTEHARRRSPRAAGSRREPQRAAESRAGGYVDVELLPSVKVYIFLLSKKTRLSSLSANTHYHLVGILQRVFTFIISQ